MRLETQIAMTAGFETLAARVDEVLPVGEKVAAFFNAFADDVADFIKSGDALGVDAVALIGAGLKIEMRILPTTVEELAAVVVAKEAKE
jgi:hypothetical protein